MNYVLAWMTLRWQAVIPRTITHGVSNIMVVSGICGAHPWGVVPTIFAWATLAYVLFLYRPILVPPVPVSVTPLSHGTETLQPDSPAPALKL